LINEFLQVVGDAFFSKETQDALRDAQVAAGKAGGVSVYEGVNHGFVTRGDYANDASVKDAADKALDEVIKFLDTHLA
jgi:dienelactone hydrolase